MTGKLRPLMRIIPAGAVVAAGLAVMLMAPTQLWAGSGVNTGYFGGVAIKGYDPVAYFKMSRAVEGSPDLAHEWLGETWYFDNDEHRQDFISDPIR